MMLADTPDDSHRVRQIAVPAAARALCALQRADYEDAFLVDTGRTSDRTAEQWARLFLEDAPLTTRSALLSGWTALGLKLDLTQPESCVLGWPVRRNAADFLVLAAGSRLGLAAELLFQRRRRQLLFATFVQLKNAVARAMWAGVEPVHVPVVRRLLEQAAERTDVTA